MADDFQALGVAIGDDAEGRVALDHERGVHQLAVNAPGKRRACET
jgi:hypothetical protein